MQRRATHGLRGATADFEASSQASSADLHQAITDFKTASDEAAGRLVVATWVLVGLTVGLLAVTVALIIHAS